MPFQFITSLVAGAPTLHSARPSRRARNLAVLTHQAASTTQTASCLSDSSTRALTFRAMPTCLGLPSSNRHDTPSLDYRAPAHPTATKRAASSLPRTDVPSSTRRVFPPHPTLPAPASFDEPSLCFPMRLAFIAPAPALPTCRVQPDSTGPVKPAPANCRPTSQPRPSLSHRDFPHPPAPGRLDLPGQALDVSSPARSDHEPTLLADSVHAHPARQPTRQAASRRGSTTDLPLRPQPSPLTSTSRALPYAPAGRTDNPCPCYPHLCSPCHTPRCHAAPTTGRGSR